MQIKYPAAFTLALLSAGASNSGASLEGTFETHALVNTPQKWTLYAWATGAVTSIVGAWAAMDAARHGRSRPALRKSPEPVPPEFSPWRCPC